MSTFLLDTHLLLWAAIDPKRLPADVRDLITDAANTLVFSVVSLWEVVIKTGLGRADFRVDAGRLRRGLLEAGYRELPITSEHAIAASHLPQLHKDPFDRMLVAQAETEGVTLLTSDPLLARYAGAVRMVG